MGCQKDYTDSGPDDSSEDWRLPPCCANTREKLARAEGQLNRALQHVRFFVRDHGTVAGRDSIICGLCDMCKLLAEIEAEK